jgi:hypothetical protein
MKWFFLLTAVMTGFVCFLWAVAFIYCVVTLRIVVAIKCLAVASTFAWGVREVWDYYLEATHPTTESN